METAQEYLTRLANAGLLPEPKLAELWADSSLCALPPKELANELVRRKLVSKYQSVVLLRTAKARFDYGPYRVVGRHVDGFRSGMFQAIDRRNRRRVELDRLETQGPIGTLNRSCVDAAHPNLIGCMDVLDEGGQSIAVLEQGVGTLLANEIEKRQLSTDEVADIVRQVSLACWDLHSRGLSHGLICPAAILINDGVARLMWRPGRSLQENGAIGERLLSLAGEFQSAEHTDSDFGGDVFALGKLLDRLTVGTSRPSHVDQLIDVATDADGKRFAHAGVVAALLSMPTAGLSSNRAVESAHEREPTTEPVVVVEQAGGPLGLATEEGSQADRLRERRSASKRKQILWGGAAALLTLVGGWFISQGFKANSTFEFAARDPGGDGSAEATLGDKPTRVDRAEEGIESAAVAPDAGETLDSSVESLWMSPTSGGPIDLSLLPPSAQMYVYLRPSAILSNAHSRRSLEALGPAFQARRKDWETATGLAWESLDSLAAAVVPRDSGVPDVCWVARSGVGVAPPTRWADARSIQVFDQTLIELNNIVIWDSHSGYVIGSEPVVRQAIAGRDASTLLRRELEQLRKRSDRQHLFSALFVPRFITTEGRKITSAQTHPIQSTIVDAIGDQTRACSVGMHIDADQFFGELRFASGDTGAVQQSRELREHVRRLPQTMESAIAGLPTLDGYWRRLALRSVRMMQFTAQNFRVGFDRRSVVANVSLPPAAAHNLFMAIELVTAASDLSPAIASSNGRSTYQQKSMEDVLRQRLTLDIPQQSIEFALRDIAEQVNSDLDVSSQIEIKIDGPALQADGITRNQQIRSFRRNDATLGEILTGLVMKANPVTTVQSPSETEQKLVWVRLTEPSAGAERIILITTRTVATEKGYSLPNEFREK